MKALTRHQERRRTRALDFSDRFRPGAIQFNGGGPLLPHMRERLNEQKSAAQVQAR